MKFLTKALAIIFISTLVSCSSPLNKKYNESTINEDLTDIVNSKKADSSDAHLIVMYIVRAKIGNRPLDNKTYGEMLKEAKEFKAKTDKKNE